MKLILLTFGLFLLLPSDFLNAETGEIKSETASTSVLSEEQLASPEDRFLLGWAYFTGEGATQNRSQALALFRQAAEMGEINSQLALGYAFEHGIGVERAPDKARIWYRAAAQQKDGAGRIDSERLAGMFVRTISTMSMDLPSGALTRNVTANEEINLEKERLSDAVSAAVAKMDAAARSKQSTVTGEKIVLPSADKETVQPLPAKYSLQQTSRRFRDILKQAESGNTEAQVTLGWFFSSGKEITADKPQAYQWYLTAGRSGNIKAQMALGWLLYSGDGIPRNLDEALLWYRKAATQGDDASIKMVKKIEAILFGQATTEKN